MRNRRKLLSNMIITDAKGFINEVNRDYKKNQEYLKKIREIASMFSRDKNK